VARFVRWHEGILLRMLKIKYYTTITEIYLASLVFGSNYLVSPQLVETPRLQDAAFPNFELKLEVSNGILSARRRSSGS
jgi:hypothetical protein